MEDYDIFSTRQKRLRGEVPDVYQYETIPDKLRVQVVFIWEYALGELYRHELGHRYPTGAAKVFELIHRILCYKYGKPSLGSPRDSVFESVRDFFLETQDTERAIDVIELSFKCIDDDVRNHPNKFRNRAISPDGAIKELNDQFRKNSVGYQYESGLIIRVDSQLIHSEVVKPALIMLSDRMYKGANAEFLKAHDHYLNGRYEECMNDCLKAFESCIKAICKKRRWPYNDRDTINPLIAIIFDHKLIPDFMESHFTGFRKALDVRKGLRSALESGVPTLRNNLSAHGDGTEEVPVPEYIAAYTLHLTASNILFLAKANEEMK